MRREYLLCCCAFATCVTYFDPHSLPFRHFSSNGQPAIENPFPRMSIDSPSINYPVISPKIEPVHTPFTEATLGMANHYNYPWSSVDAVESNGGSFPRVNIDHRDGLSQSPETDFRAWFAVDSDAGDGGHPRKTSSGDGSSAPAVDAAVSGKVRSVAVLEVRD